MKFFEAVPGELFSPLASPNRALYADALDVLYTAYRENLKIREDTLYSMLRSRLEQQLADATFEGEDILQLLGEHHDGECLGDQIHEGIVGHLVLTLAEGDHTPPCSLG